MAKANQGGTKGFLRGRVGSDLYQVTKDVSGKKVQLVRAAEVSRVNNNTVGQALARMKMAALMRALSQLKEIVDHSWEGIPYGQLSIAHFVEVNMPYVNWDVYENWAYESHFCMPVKGVAGYMIGSYKIAEGSLSTPSVITCPEVAGRNGTVTFYLDIGKANATMADLKQALGLASEDYITLLVQSGGSLGRNGVPNPMLCFRRFYVNKAIADDVKITPGNIASMFTYGGNITSSLSFSTATGRISMLLNCDPDSKYREGYAYAVIVSRWDGFKWCRNNAWFQDEYGYVLRDWNNGMPRYAFKSWFPGWDVDDGWGSHDADRYPDSKPANIKQL